MSAARDPTERFWEKVDRSGDCWLWTASVTGPGYGQFGYAAGDIRLAHRFAYELLVGPILSGLTLDHLCRNRRCVNPEHLEPVRLKENLLRGASPAAVNARKTHCVHGHPLAGRNLYVSPTTGRRQCQRCRRDAKRRFQARRRPVATTEQRASEAA
jgi:hypothetical protein